MIATEHIGSHIPYYKRFHFILCAHFISFCKQKYKYHNIPKILFYSIVIRKYLLCMAVFAYLKMETIFNLLSPSYLVAISKLAP